MIPPGFAGGFFNARQYAPGWSPVAPFIDEFSYTSLADFLILLMISFVQTEGFLQVRKCTGFRQNLTIDV